MAAITTVSTDFSPQYSVRFRWWAVAPPTALNGTQVIWRFFSVHDR
jgi:hypothetical protein